MGVYTDVARYRKSQIFLDWCQQDSHLGLWVGFGTGSPSWDTYVSQEAGGPTTRLLVPTSPPNCTLPVDYTTTDYTRLVYLDASSTQPGGAIAATLAQHADEGAPAAWTPSILYRHSTTLDITATTRLAAWDSGAAGAMLQPLYPQSYPQDYEACQYRSALDRYTPPSSATLYPTWARDVLYSENSDQRNPQGHLAWIRALVQHVTVVPPDTPENPAHFMYGSQRWALLTAEEAQRQLAHHVLISVTVYPRDLHTVELVEQHLPVRQCVVARFPILADKSLQPTTVGRVLHTSSSYYRTKHQLADTSDAVPIISFTGANDVEYTGTMNPTTDAVEYTGPELELLINDLMSARHRSIQQADRYGWIIGF